MLSPVEHCPRTATGISSACQVNMSRDFPPIVTVDISKKTLTSYGYKLYNDVKKLNTYTSIHPKKYGFISLQVRSEGRKIHELNKGIKEMWGYPRDVIVVRN